MHQSAHDVKGGTGEKKLSTARKHPYQLGAHKPSPERMSMHCVPCWWEDVAQTSLATMTLLKMGKEKACF